MLPLNRTEAESCLGLLQPDVPFITQGRGLGGVPCLPGPPLPLPGSHSGPDQGHPPEGHRGPGGRCSPGRFPPQAIPEISGEF